MHNQYEAVKREVRRIASTFDLHYWNECDTKGQFPEEVYALFANAGYLGALLPPDLGGSYDGLAPACAILETINELGGDAAVINAAMSIPATFSRLAQEPIRGKVLQEVLAGHAKMLAVAATEPESGAEMANVSMQAREVERGYSLTGTKVFISFAQDTDYLLVVAKIEGDDMPSVFLVDIRQARSSVEFHPIRMTANRRTCEVVFSNTFVPGDYLLRRGKDALSLLGKGFSIRRILAACECIGSTRFLLDSSVRHVSERVLEGKILGIHQGIQFPLAHLFCELLSVDALKWQAVKALEAGQNADIESAAVRIKAGELFLEAARTAMMVHGAWGIATEYGLERKYREAAVFNYNNRLLVHVATHGLGLPKQ